MLVNRSRSLGLDPLTAAGIQLALPVANRIIGAIFGDDDAAKAAQVQALMLAQAQAKAAEMRRWLIAGGVVAALGLVVVMMRR